MPYAVMFGTQDDRKTKRPVRINNEGQLVPAPSVESIWFQATIVLGGTTSTIVNLGGMYKYLKVIIPTIDSATLKLQVSDTEGGTFRDLGASVTTATTTGAYSDTWNLAGWRYVRIVASAAQTTVAVTFSVQGVTF